MLFTRPSWQRVLVLVTGAILTPHRRTVSAALRVTGHAQAAAGFIARAGRRDGDPDPDHRRRAGLTASATDVPDFHQQ